MKKILLLAFAICILLPASAFAALTAVGPNSRTNGFPLYYQDSNGLKLGLCLDKRTHCLPLEDVNMRRPIRFPTNFPGEAFWWAAETEVETAGGGSVLLVLALEAAFTNDRPQRNQRISFARVRIRGFSMPVGTYRITHPYGQNTFTVSSVERRNINFTDDVGIERQNFNGALAGAIGPFLVWDPATLPAAPAGFIGDPSIPHKVVGSPSGRNYLRVEKIDGGAPVEVGFTNLFNVAGKIRP